MLDLAQTTPHQGWKSFHFNEFWATVTQLNMVPRVAFEVLAMYGKSLLRSWAKNGL